MLGPLSDELGCIAIAFAAQQLAKAFFALAGGNVRMKATDIEVSMPKSGGGAMVLKGIFFSGCLSIACDRT